MHSRKMKALVLGAVWTLGGIVGCDGTIDTNTPEPPKQEDLTVLPQATPTHELAASAAATEATGGVTQWKLYDSVDVTGTRVYGVNATGQVVTVLRIGGEQLSTDQPTSVVMESLLPAAGRLEIDGTGKAVRNDLSPAAMRTISAMAVDFKAVAESGTLQPDFSFACLRAGVILVGACGVTIAGCLETAGLACVVGSVLCYEAYLDWLCACHHIDCF